MRCIPRSGRLPHCCVLSFALLAACAGQVSETADDGASIARGAEVTSALRHDDSAPLLLMPVAPRSGRLVEHEVKKLPRAFNLNAPADPVRQAAAPALLVPATSRNFDGVGQGFSGPQGSFSVSSAPPDTTPRRTRGSCFAAPPPPHPRRRPPHQPNQPPPPPPPPLFPTKRSPPST